ncbi:MAG TPA: helix-turn-helix transcriptional regulator [Bryobacteraceae bacterium]|nr:helix-turn-helix transcriptional regulator [Bryobacteraceae bacterium]
MSDFRQADEASIQIRSFGVTFRHGQQVPPQYLVPPAAGMWHQLVCANRGALTVRTEDCAWVVPPHRAVWLPAGFQYRLEMTGVVAVRMLYIRPARGARSLPRDCSVVNVTPLLRELMQRTVSLGALDAAIPEQKRLIGVILDELRVLVAMPLQLPMPRDARALRFAGLANRHSGPALSTKLLLRQCGTSRRTMERLFRAETGMSLGQWQRRQTLLQALRRLASGENVGSLAGELGYNSPSAFIAMFRRELGQTPKRYFER